MSTKRLKPANNAHTERLKHPLHKTELLPGRFSRGSTVSAIRRRGPAPGTFDTDAAEHMRKDRSAENTDTKLRASYNKMRT
jgi:hypothetical protein